MSRHAAQLTPWAAYRRHRDAFRNGTLRAACRRRARQLAGNPTPWATLELRVRPWPAVELP